ncbi:unnamed protein product [Amaranthus hypochondriacus]
MSINYSILVLLFISFLIHNTSTTARTLPNSTNTNNSSILDDLATNNNTNTTTDCWTSLSKLRTCSNEIVGLFLNGYTEIDEPCCEAIEVIIHHCLPSMISVLGYTVEEGNLLAAYCTKISGPAGVTLIHESKSTTDNTHG